jgi:tRNA modification GTPase
LDEASAGLAAGAAVELVAESLRHAHDRLGEIVGTVTADDLLGKIFAEFCIGK